MGFAAHYVVPHRQVVEAVVLRGCGQVDSLHLGAGGGGGRRGNGMIGRREWKIDWEKNDWSEGWLEHHASLDP